MTEVNREYLIIPTPKELTVAFDSMKGRILRAYERGERPREFGDIGYVNANRILKDSSHLDQHFQALAQTFNTMQDDPRITLSVAFMAGVRDVLEVLAVATTLTQLPDLGDSPPSE